MRYSAPTMRRHVQAQAAGSASVARYCGRHDLKVSTFYYWKNKLAEASDLPPSTAPTPGFTELRPRLSPSQAASGPVWRLRLPGGLQVEVSGLAIEEMADLLHAIERRSHA